MNGGKQDLAALAPRHDFLVGVDSDGCVFDTMEAKQKQHFHPAIVRWFGLEPVAPQVREAAEYVNLRSPWRGSNRYLNLLRTLDLLATCPDVRTKGVPLPDTGSLRSYVESGGALGQPTLIEAVDRRDDHELRRVLDWSRGINRSIEEAELVIPPFAGVTEALGDMRERADLIVVSQTPADALRREWALHGIDALVRFIAGQELGSKADHLALAATDKYPPERVLMIGDAPGDREAAVEHGACFFPVLPGNETESWRRLREEGFPRFLAGKFAGAYQEELEAEFSTLLEGTTLVNDVRQTTANRVWLDRRPYDGT